jgi:hypothetical protein
MVLFRWLIRFSLAIVGLLVLAAALAVFNNNVSLSGRSRVDFANTLDRSLAASAGQGLDLLEIRGWDDAALGVIKV